VAPRLQRRQHPLKRFENRGRPYHGFSFDGGFIKPGFPEQLGNPFFCVWIGEPFLRKILSLIVCSDGICPRSPQNPRKKVLHGSTKLRIDDGHLAAPQPQNVPDEIGDLRDIHLLDNSAWLDFLIESIADAIELIPRFGDEQRQRRQQRRFSGLSSRYLRSHLFCPRLAPAIAKSFKQTGSSWRFGDVDCPNSDAEKLFRSVPERDQ